MSKDAEFVKLLTTVISSADSEEQRALDALKQLARHQVTAELLGRTDAGKKVKKLGKHSNPAIKAAANATVEAWKECVRMEQKKKQEVGSKRAPEGEPTVISLDGDSQDPSVAAGPSTSKALSGCPSRCGDPTRDKIRDLLAESLAMACSEEVQGDPCAMAVEVEQAMFQTFGSVNQQYKAKYRTLAFNLKDPKNPDLRAKVLLGQLPADILVNLSAEELASDDRRQNNDKIRDYKKKECERGQSNQASTDMFKCGKCKQRKTTYYQLQTRSADEPMTTFVSCVNCGNRWKFC